MRGLVSPDCVFVRTLTYTLSICVDGVKGRTSSRVAYSTRISLAGRKHRAPSFGRPGSMLLCWSWRAPSSQSVPTSPCQRDGASRCRLDAAAIAGGDNRGCQAQASDSRSRPDFGEASGRFDPGLGLAVLRLPVASPKANAICERVSERFGGNAWIGRSRSPRRTYGHCWNEWESHTLQQWPPSQCAGTGRAGSAATNRPVPEVQIPPSAGGGCLVRVKAVLGGLHHEYSLATTTTHTSA